MMVAQTRVQTAGQKAKRRARNTKTNQVAVLRRLSDIGFASRLTQETYENIGAAGIRWGNFGLAVAACQILLDENPITLRGLFYRIVSAGVLPSTAKSHYHRLSRLLTSLREYGVVPFAWLTDSARSTIKPSSWSGLDDFAETAARAYRMDFWARLPQYVHVICEKDAIAGTLAPVTREFDVALSPIRGYSSLTFAHEIASKWNQIAKPIFVYYLGDFDPSGFDLERDIRAKLTRYCDRPFRWERLGVTHWDFEEFNLLPLKPKKKDARYEAFVDRHGERCAEVDALPPTELRRRVREAIETHIPADEWERLWKSSG